MSPLFQFFLCATSDMPFALEVLFFAGLTIDQRIT